MVVGEAPGLVEDQTGKPFMGPAGQLLDKIIQSIGLDPDRDFYIGNMVKHRPVDHSGSRQNLTPSQDSVAACLPFILKEIDLIRPKVVLCAGSVAARHLIPSGNLHMKDLVGRTFSVSRFPGTEFIVMYHPAAVLHASNDPARCGVLKRSIWHTMLELKGRHVDFEGTASFPS